MDDLWHASINARGRLLNADNAEQVSQAVASLWMSSMATSSFETSAASTAITVPGGARKYTSTYRSGTWVGNVVATQIETDNGSDVCTIWMVQGQSPGAAAQVGYPPAPCPGRSATPALRGIPEPAVRHIYAWNGSSYGDFDASNAYVAARVKPTEGLGGNARQLIDYLRGDQSLEDAKGVPNYYRARAALLGDIVHSRPTLVQAGSDLGYTRLPMGSCAQGYGDYRARKIAGRPEGVLFVGANDGMLHGFRDSTGVEAFAFVPQAVMPQLPALARRSYTHQYYVDGQLSEADACLDGLAWSNLLLGTLGAGGKSVFALRFPLALPPSSTMGLSGTSILWEITSTTSGFANLGNIVASDIQTGLAMNGQWVGVFGNGYYGADGTAHLYIVDLRSGSLLRDIVAGAVNSGNGLSGVTLVRDASQRIIGAYAGDLQGNLWKFDLSSANRANWQLGLAGAALYAAGSSQPITAAPLFVTHPLGGRVVAFGTGQYLNPPDATSSTQQALYGIWDSVPFGDPLPGTPARVAQTGLS
ncbi:MAG: pilus assembly protein, partial [Rhodoferax sp.]